MPLNAEQIDELRAAITVSRKRDINFGLCMGKTPADAALEMDRLKSPEVLMRRAKKAEGVSAPKSTFGTLFTKGKVMSLTCLAEPPAGLAKHMRMFFMASGLPMKVKILGADGALLEEDGEADEAGTDDAGPEDRAEVENPLAARWRDGAAALEPVCLARIAAGGEDAAKLRSAWDYATEAAGREDYATALTVLARLGQALAPAPSASEATEVPPDPPADQLKEMVLGLLRTLPGDIAALSGIDPALKGKLDEALRLGIAAAKSADYATALKWLDSCAEVLARLATKRRVDEARDSVPEGTVAARIREIELATSLWRTERLRTIEGLDALTERLLDEADDDLQKIAGRIAVLAEDIPDALESALLDLQSVVNAGDISRVPPAKAAVQQVLRDAASYLKANVEPLRRCESNPFGITVAIVKPLSETLQSVQKAIASL